jgi:DNA phosphorothioation-dependent restriction protein DptH
MGLLRHYVPEQLRISAVDPKSTELAFLEEYPHLDGDIGWDAEDAKQLLDAAVERMQVRYARMKSEKVRKLSDYNAIEGIERLPWRLVILDEFADLTSDRDDKRDIEHSLQRLAQKARACGIHVIVATQKPSAEVLSTKVRSNLGAQLALRVKTATDSRIIMDASGAEALAGNGDAFLKTAGGGMVRFQCAKV